MAEGRAVTIEEQAAAYLDPVLADCLRQRTALGVAKYGQRLEDNDQPFRARLVHLVQELLDATQYAVWAGMSGYAYGIAEVANELQGEWNLTADEIMSGGKR